MTLKVVCFDIGGVLARIRTDWGACAEAAGLHSHARRLEGRTLSDFELFDPYQQGLVGTRTYIAQLSRYLDGLSAPQAEAVHNAILAEPYAGTSEIIDRLGFAEVLTACLSNTNELHWEAMCFSGRFPGIERILCPIVSHAVGAVKPMDEIYDALEEAAGARGADIVYFEDHGPYVDAARARGWDAVLVDPRNDPAGQIRSHLKHRRMVPDE